MKKFNEWVKLKESFPNLGQHAIPITQKPKQISLSSLADQVSDPSWHQLYDIFSNQYQKFPNDPQVSQLGQALYQAAQSGDMTALQAYKQKYLFARRIN